MSLNVYLTLEGTKHEAGSGIFVRDHGETKEISRAEWDKRYPNREPIIAKTNPESDIVYSANITHNLGKMAEAALIYKHLWRPDEIGITKASQLIEPLTYGLAFLVNFPRRFEKFNPPNGWGDYGGLVRFVRDYLAACRKYPDAIVGVSR